MSYHVNAAFGFNGATLQVCGFVRYTQVSNLISVVVNMSLNRSPFPVIVVNRRLLDVANTFLEVLRVPGARRLLGSSR